MFCPQCRTEYRKGFVECSDCHIPLADHLPEPETLDAPADADDLDVLIQTGLAGPIAIGLAEGLLREAGVPFFAMDQNSTARQESGNILGWWNVRVSSEREAEAREILRSVEEMK
ncbi:MAG: DUF2007 domain-containing protein [Bryobacteraceae bacterium]|jgi:hypothetical protein